MLLLERALAAMKDRDDKNTQYRIEQEAREIEQLRKDAVYEWNRKLLIDVKPENVKVEDRMATTEYEGVTLACRRNASSGHEQLYVGVPCPNREDTTIEHLLVLEDCHDLSSLGDALSMPPTRDCWNCQERRENAEPAGDGDRAETVRPMNAAERLTAAIQDVINDAVVRAIEP